MSTVKQHLGLLWLLRNKSVNCWEHPAMVLMQSHLDELIALVGGADIEDFVNHQFPVIPKDFPWTVPLKPIDMVLYCPQCGVQHIDKPDRAPFMFDQMKDCPDLWINPPHRSHLCAGCGYIWRPADVPTNGVKSIATRGTKDSPIVVAK